MALYKHSMERRQQERERWFAATLKSIGDGVVATDGAGQVTFPHRGHGSRWRRYSVT